MARRPAHARARPISALRGRPGCSAHARSAWTRPTRASRAALSPHADTDGLAPPVSSSSFARGGSAATPAAVSEVLGPRVRVHPLRLDLATSLPPSTRALLSPSSPATRKAGGRHGRPSAGHWGSVEREPARLGGSGSVKEQGAHNAGLWEVAETAGDEDDAVGRVLRLR